MKLSSARYISTRGKSPSQSFLQILLSGLAPDGGLYMPETYPRLGYEELEKMRGMNYQELAFTILSHFIDDIPSDDLKGIIDRTYTAEVFCNTRPGENPADIVPLRTLEPGLHLLGLSNGPTLAFKDVAMQLLGNLFEYALGVTGGELNILGATSGDTGSAAEYAMLGKKGIRVFMLSPWEGMSPFQRAQMCSLDDPGIVNISIHGNFDMAQDLVKAVSGDSDFKKAHSIGAVNSINWARIAAQIVYYFKAYFAATKDSSERVLFSIPSGNFGNACAGHIARTMGLPIDRLIVATNENNVLDQLIYNGIYRPRKSNEVHITSSPSMDISKASNFERFMFDLVGRDPSVLLKYWAELDKKGYFDISRSPLFLAMHQEFGFASNSSNHSHRIRTIRGVYRSYGTMIDPHTADAFMVGMDFRQEGIPLIVLETAQPAKFESTIREALDMSPEVPEKLRGIEGLPPRYVEFLNPDVETLKRIISEHRP